MCAIQPAANSPFVDADERSGLPTGQTAKPPQASGKCTGAHREVIAMFPLRPVAERLA